MESFARNKSAVAAPSEGDVKYALTFSTIIIYIIIMAYIITQNQLSFGASCTAAIRRFVGVESACFVVLLAQTFIADFIDRSQRCSSRIGPGGK